MSYYDLLGIAVDAADDDVRRAYLAQARRHHPDAGGNAAAMTALNEAWAVLSDPARRRRYDVELGVKAAPSSPWSPVIDDDEVFDDRFDDIFDDRLDDRPLTDAGGPSFLPLLPPVVFALAVGVGCVALVLDAPAVLGLAFLLFLFSCVAVAVVALLMLRGSVRRPGSGAS